MNVVYILLRLANYKNHLIYSGFDPRQGQRIFLLAPASRLALGPTQPPVGTGGPFPLGKVRPGHDADHSPPSSAEVKYE
jgi:hypothetical protein